MYIRNKPQLLRARLLDGLTQSVGAARFTLISAPPASGKNTLLDQFRRRLPAPCVELADDGQPPPQGGVAMLRNAEQWAPQRLEALLQRVEQGGDGGLRLVISANRPLDHLLPVARLRRQVISFGPDELALSRSEVRDFMTPDASQLIELDDLNRIYRRIGGWIGAWNIVEAMAENGATLAEIATAMTGALPVFRQFFSRHLEELDPPARDAILRLAHFDEVTPELISAVLQCDVASGQELAHSLPSTCPFLVRRHDGVSFAPYPLFRDYVAQLAQRSAAQQYRDDLNAAAQSAMERADWLRAAMCYIRAGARQTATALLAEHTEEMITNRGEVARFRQLTRALQSDTDLEASLASELALGAIFAGAFGHARSLIDRAQARTPEELARKEAISLCISFGRDELEHVRATAPQWLQRNKAANPRFTAMVAVSLFWSAMEMLDVGAAERALATARSHAHHANAGLIQDWLAVCEACLYWEQGRVADADNLLGRTTATGPCNHTINHVRAALAWERGDIPFCRHLLASSLHRGARHSVAETAFLGWSSAAALYFAEGQPERALRLLGEAETTMMARHGERARQMMQLARARMLLQLTGATDAGHEPQHGASRAVAPAPVGRFPALDEARRLLQARRLAHVGEHRQAISILQPIAARAQKQGRLRIWAEASLIYAGALARLGEAERAARVAWPAISQVAAAGGGRAILSERLLLAPLLDDLLRRAALDGADARAAALLAELGRASGVAPEPGPAPELADAPPPQLTETERRILALANRGLSNSLIASHLLIKVSTVKWHLHNTFEKLAVRSRTAAIAQARKAGIPLD